MMKNTFPTVKNPDGSVSYGADQAWFSSAAAALGGCGAAAAVNSLAALALHYPELSQKLGLPESSDGEFSREKFRIFMDKVCSCVGTSVFFGRPMGIGIWRYTKSVLQYAASHDVFLESHVCVTTYVSGNLPVRFIKNGLAKCGAVALLASWNSYTAEFSGPCGTAEAKIKNHFITITGMEKTAEGLLLTISTWGKKGTVSYKEVFESWQGAGAVDTALIYFTPTGTKRSVRRQIAQAPLLLCKSVSRLFFHSSP